MNKEWGKGIANTFQFGVASYFLKLSCQNYLGHGLTGLTCSYGPVFQSYSSSLHLFCAYFKLQNVFPKEILK